MSRTRLTLGVCCLFITIVAHPAAADDGWSLPNLNPFKKSEKPVSNADRGLPATWNKVTQGTKSFCSKTYDVLTPWDTKAEKAKASRARSPQPFTNASREKKPEKKGFLTGWLHEAEEPRQPQTVSEWLAQPRP